MSSNVLNPTATADEVLEQLTIDEKIALCSAQDWWRTVPIRRGDSLLLPHIKMTDGPNGARGESFVSGIRAACFPCIENIAATFDRDVAYQLGKEVALEARSKSADVSLAPTAAATTKRMERIRMCLGSWGRLMSTVSKDPHHITKKPLSFYVVAHNKGMGETGCQSVGVAATPKHFVANEVEQRRRFVSAEIDERTLREIYLYPFQLILKHSDPWCLMTSYNKVNGTYTSETPRLIQSILREEWGFKGLVMSDWVGTYSTVEAMNAGLDIEMPAPSVYRGERLLRAVEDGTVSVEVLNERAKKVIELVQRSNRMADPDDKPEEYRVCPERDEFIARASADGIVLLKNENGVLPLKRAAKVVVIGQHAASPPIGGGGSAQVTTEHVVTPIQALKAAGVDFTYEPGVPIYGAVPLPDPEIVSPTGCSEREAKPVRIEWFNGSKIGENPVKGEMSPKPEYMIKEKWPTYLDRDFCARITFDLTPKTSGNHTFAVVTTGTATLYIDGKEVYHRPQEPVLQRESFYFFRTKLEKLVTYEMEAHRRYSITLESWATPPDIARGSIGGEVVQGSAVGFLEYVDVQGNIRAAARAAEASDVAVVFTGTTPEFESEGFDRTTMDLRPAEYDLVEAVAAANPNTVVVNISGSPVTLDRVHDQVAGLVQAWFAGQEVGTSVARILTGEVNPSGRLPISWPRRIEDNPAHGNWPGENDVVHYKEGIFVGYRHYDKPGRPSPLFPFGFGLSYTTFGNVELSVLGPAVLGEEKNLRVLCTVANTGAVAGKVVVQFYVRRLSVQEGGSSDSAFVRVAKELKSFRKQLIQPLSSADIEVELDRHAVSVYDADVSAWRVEEGTYEVLAAFSAEDIVARAKFQAHAYAYSHSHGYSHDYNYNHNHKHNDNHDHNHDHDHDHDHDNNHEYDRDRILSSHTHDRNNFAETPPANADGGHGKAGALSTPSSAATSHPIKVASLPFVRPSSGVFYLHDELYMIRHNHLSVQGSDTSTRAMPVLIYRAMKCGVNTLRARQKAKRSYTDETGNTMLSSSPVNAIGPGEIERPMGKRHDWTQDWDFIFSLRNSSMVDDEQWVADACLYFNGLSIKGGDSIPWNDRSRTQRIDDAGLRLPSKYECKGLKAEWLKFTWKVCERSDPPRWGGSFTIYFQEDGRLAKDEKSPSGGFFKSHDNPWAFLKPTHITQ
ncbi:related to beta-glucosidase [Cephalotrichum gorgonifer]|uniref:beta-glucosidase n=1 Tax=Cephalotrichum gorgonifer TaxID=2041049 RepID=A0AAE8MXN2_9PEZI|nr:related to beta-glucosidase [Cephalotrichum gorgonifer]